MTQKISRYPHKDDNRDKWYQSLVEVINLRHKAVANLVEPYTTTGVSDMFLDVIVDRLGYRNGASYKFRVWGKTAANANNKRLILQIFDRDSVYILASTTTSVLNNSQFIFEGEVQKGKETLAVCAQFNSDGALAEQVITTTKPISSNFFDGFQYLQLVAIGGGAGDLVIYGAKIEFSEAA